MAAAVGSHQPLARARLTAGLLHQWQQRNLTASLPLALRQLEVAGNLDNVRLAIQAGARRGTAGAEGDGATGADGYGAAGGTARSASGRWIRCPGPDTAGRCSWTRTSTRPGGHRLGAGARPPGR